ncbi:MAG: DUF2207 domain-containing protein [Patescibacteria group bacterium]|nr:DUF2207 domain-containing protein [Patescibacteria group bacterium]
MKKVFVFLFFFFFLVLPVFSQFDDIEKDQVNVTLITETSSYSQKTIKSEHIRLFKSDIYINKDGTLSIKETIIYDFSDLKKHGIYRKIPMIKTNQDGKKYVLDYSEISVIDDKNLPYRYSRSVVDNYLQLKIGDPDKTITGVHTYIISYKVKGAITYFSDHDELYWNVVGNEWEIPIEKAKIEIFLPEKIEEKNLRADCFTGFYGQKKKNCQFSFDNNFLKEKIFFENNEGLVSKEGLTVVVGFPKNIVLFLEPKEYKSFWETFFGKVTVFLIFLAGVFWYVFLPFYIIYRWFKYGRDPKPINTGEVSAWFDPPKSPDGKRFLTPAEVGVLGDETVDLKDISAIIVDLARRGFLKIEERKKGEFWLVKIDKEETSLLFFERKLIKEFFGNRKEINLKKVQLYQEVEKVKKLVYQEVVSIGLFPDNPEKIRTRMMILAFFGLVTGNLFLAFSGFVFGRNLPRKTDEGVKAKLTAFSLRNFLKSQERQLTFQADKQMMFEKLLPYAIVFGVERIWAQRFKNLDLKPPEWYQSYDQKTFNSLVFANSLNSSLSSFRSSAQPLTSTRSTSGFSSGFSSGGFSGGGGGGGGGGSW